MTKYGETLHIPVEVSHAFEKKRGFLSPTVPVLQAPSDRENRHDLRHDPLAARICGRSKSSHPLR